MSYTRRFTKTIQVHYSGSVSYPASQHGGTKSYSGTTTERIVFDVEVDTDPFDEAVGDMNNHVDLLTGSVVATEAAHVATINETSKQVGDTIISGFFKTVRSDITQQMTELKTRADALMLQLNRLAQRCHDKKKQMGVDYQRISQRYTKIFTDLNNELENRIYSIDEPVFRIRRTLDEVGTQTGKDASVSTVSITAGENARAHSIIASTLAKRQAIEAIDKGEDFLRTQYNTDRVLDKCLMQKDGEASLSTPFCIMEASSEQGVTERKFYASPLLDCIENDILETELDELGWNNRISDYGRKAITDYFNNSAADAHGKAKSEHDKRVAELTMRLFDISDTAVPGK